MAKIKVGNTVTTLDDLLFPVEMIDNPNLTNSEYAKVIIGHTERGTMDLNYCSKTYGFVPNENIFPKIEETLNDHGIKFESKYTHVKDVRFYGDYRINDANYTYRIKGTSDEIFPMIRVQHSYNGMTKYRIMLGYFRLVCANGLVIAVQEMKDFNLQIVGKHTVEAIKRSLVEFDGMLERFCNEAPTITKAITSKYEKLASSKLTVDLEDRITEVLEASKITAVDNAKFNTVNTIVNQINLEMDKNLGYTEINDWLVYNGINWYLNEGSRNTELPEKRIETDSRVLEYLLETV